MRPCITIPVCPQPRPGAGAEQAGCAILHVGNLCLP